MRPSICSGGSIERPGVSVGTTKNIWPPSSVAAPVTMVCVESAPVTHGQMPSSRHASPSRVAASAGRPRCRRLVVSCEMPTVVNTSPRARGGRSSCFTSAGPPAMIRTAAAHCVRASEVVRHRSAIATSAGMRPGSPAAVPPCSPGIKAARRPLRARAAKAPLRQGPSADVRTARSASDPASPSISGTAGNRVVFMG